METLDFRKLGYEEDLLNRIQLGSLKIPDKLNKPRRIPLVDEPVCVVDEDVDLCCRLIADGYQPWFETEPATILDRNPNIPRLTNAIANERNAECYLRSFTQNYKVLKNEPGATAFLAARALRMILRSGSNDLLNALLKEEISEPVRAMLWGKRVITTLRRRQ